MTIELITGTPGAGKTTYAVSQRVVPESRRKLPMEDGTEYERRIVAAGVRGLIAEHERLPHKLTGEVVPDAEVEYYNQMETGDSPVFQRLAGAPVVTEITDPRSGELKEVRPLVQNWWLWCKPGDLIVIDEAQFLAPRGSLGKKPPYWIQALEIHRHYGVDFVIITQHPQLIDTTIRNLVGCHRHIRSVMGSAMCMVYTWDHASNPERYQLASKGKFLRRAAHYKMFHSSVAHIKPPSAGRGLLFMVPLLLGFAAYGYVQFKARHSVEAVPVSSSQAAPVAVAAASSGAPGRPWGYDDVPPLMGCMAVDDKCDCWTKDGARKVKVDLQMCKLSSSSYDGLVPWEKRAGEHVPEAASAPHTASVLPSVPS